MTVAPSRVRSASDRARAEARMTDDRSIGTVVAAGHDPRSSGSRVLVVRSQRSLDPRYTPRYHLEVYYRPITALPQITSLHPSAESAVRAAECAGYTVAYTCASHMG